MKQKEYDFEYKFFVDLQVWEDMQPLYKILGKESPPKPVFVPSEIYKNRYEFE